MMSFAAAPNAFTESWGPALRDFGKICNQGLGSLLVVWMLLFGIYFPEPFLAGARWRWWDWAKWLFGVPLILDAVMNAIISVGQTENHAVVASPGRVWGQTSKFTTVCSFAAMSTFFACVWVKSYVTIPRDAKRRLRLVYAGACFAFTPFLILIIIASLRHVEKEEYFPQWLSFTHRPSAHDGQS